MTPQDDANLVRFLIDLAGGITPEDRDRANARLRGDRPDPPSEATGGPKRTPEATSKRDGTVSGQSRRPHWPAKAWWAK